ncbi:MAG TPA: FecR domain-containing protein [Sphingomicrobium sp.]
MQPDQDRARQEAVSWRIRLRDADAGTWEEFADWLREGPQNNRAYDEIAMLDEEMEAPRRIEPAAADGQGRARGWGRRIVIGGGLAAAASIAAALLVGGPFDRPQPSAHTVATGAGERRVVELADGSRVTLNGASAVAFDRDDPRLAHLVRGEALFAVVHKPGSPFRVNVAGYALTDLGTSFVVERREADIRVEVASGLVRIANADSGVDLGPGSVAKSEGGRLKLERKDPSSIGTWANGYLSYTNAPLGDVARDLARATGEQVAVSSGSADSRFTGIIRLNSDHRRLFAAVGAMVGLPVRRTAAGWVIGEGMPNG